MTEETMIPLATPTRFLMENGEWNLTPSLLNEINPFDYNTYRPVMKEQQPQPSFLQQQEISDPESDTTSSLSTSPASSSDSFNHSPSASFNQSPIFNNQPLYQPVVEPTQTMTTKPKKTTSVSSGRKRRIIFEGEDAEERRKKFLERNRVAAYKCRQKKKTWMQDLENRAEVQNKQNEDLRNMVAQLKEESMYLRNLLLTHGNCDCESVQAYLRKTSLEISNNTPPLKRNSSFSSTGLTPFLNTVIKRPPEQQQQDYFSSYHNPPI